MYCFSLRDFLDPSCLFMLDRINLSLMMSCRHNKTSHKQQMIDLWAGAEGVDVKNWIFIADIWTVWTWNEAADETRLQTCWTTKKTTRKSSWVRLWLCMTNIQQNWNDDQVSVWCSAACCCALSHYFLLSSTSAQFGFIFKSCLGCALTSTKFVIFSLYKLEWQLKMCLLVDSSQLH